VALLIPLLGATPVDAQVAARDSAIYPHLTGPEFLAIFDELDLPDTTPPTDPPPVITGNIEADARIRSLAERRGYQRRPASTGVQGSVDGVPYHPRAADALRELEAAADADGISIVAVSGYRSPEVQRDAFVSDLPVSPARIAAGNADAAVDDVLAWVAPPGYSKHQTGYAVDLVQAGGTVGGFASTAAYAWISADNYRNARRFGFLPSYPPDGGLQGPNPEPWEYVFVGPEHSRAQSPIGVLEAATAAAYGEVAVRGWAIDPSAVTVGIDVHVYVGGRVDEPGTIGTDLGPATLDRPDVAAAYPEAGPNHGFGGVVDSGDLQGTVPVCAYAIDVGPGTDRLLGCLDVALPPASPFGALEAVVGGTGDLRAQGWVIDPDGTGPTGVHLYVDGRGVADIAAEQPRPDVAAAHPGYGEHRGFDHVVPVAPGTRNLCAFGINDPGTGGGNVLLGCGTDWVVDPDAAFLDLLSTGPFHDDIADLALLGVIEGYDDGTFRPAAPVSRQATVAFLHRLAGSPVGDTETGFPDVAGDHRFATEVAWAVDQGLVDGYDDGTFRPTAPVSRQATVAMLWRLAGEPGTGGSPGFGDVGAGHAFAEAIAWAEAAGIVEGYDDGTFRPAAPVSRQAAAAMLDRFRLR
jgi:hypothetical protein